MVSQIESTSEDECTISVPSKPYPAYENSNVAGSNLLPCDDNGVPISQGKPSSSSWFTGPLLSTASAIVSPKHCRPPLKGILRGSARTETSGQSSSSIIKQTWNLISEEDSLWIMVVLPIVTLCGNQMVPFLSPLSKTLLVMAIAAFCVVNWSWCIYSYCAPPEISSSETVANKCGDYNSSASASFLLRDMYSPQARERTRRVRFDDQTKLHIIPRKEKEGPEQGSQTTHNRWSNSSTDGGCRVPARQYQSPSKIQLGQRLSLMRLQTTSVANVTKVLVPLVNLATGPNSSGQPTLSLSPPSYEDSSIPETITTKQTFREGDASSSNLEPTPVPTLKEGDLSSHLVPPPSFPEHDTTYHQDNDVSLTPQEQIAEDAPFGMQESSETNADAKADPCILMETSQPMGALDTQNVDVMTETEKSECRTSVGASASDESQDTCPSLTPLDECPSDEWGGFSIPSEAFALESKPSEASVLESLYCENRNPDGTELNKTNRSPVKVADENTTTNLINDSLCDINEQFAVMSPFSMRQNSTLPLRAANRNKI
jgi:hypothetical protein